MHSMGIAPILIAALALLVLLSTAGLVAWAWLAMNYVEENQLSFVSLKAMAVDI